MPVESIGGADRAAVMAATVPIEAVAGRGGWLSRGGAWLVAAPGSGRWWAVAGGGALAAKACSASCRYRQLSNRGGPKRLVLT